MGSYLNEEISKSILRLQKRLYFEKLSGKYWNSTKRSDCPILDDSEGITLRSLGGVFICTLFGLLIAMIVLVIEVLNMKKAEKNKVQQITSAWKGKATGAGSGDRGSEHEKSREEQGSTDHISLERQSNWGRIW